VSREKDSFEMLTTNREIAEPSKVPSASKNPKRVAAGRLNSLKRKGLTPAGRERLRQTALRNQPWRKSTGPRTPEGKARSARNSRKGQPGEPSIRQLRTILADLMTLAQDMRQSQDVVRTRVGEGA
jgi:hypothetical protein